GTRCGELFRRGADGRREERFQELAVGAVIETHDPFFAAGGDNGSVGADPDGVKEIAAAAENALHAAVVDVPEADRLVAAAGDDLRCRANEQQPLDLLRVAHDGPQLFTFLVIPDLDDVVGAGAGEHLAVRAPADVEYMVGVPFESLDELAGRQL